MLGKFAEICLAHIPESQSWVPNGSPRILRLLWNLKDHYYVHNGDLTTDPVLEPDEWNPHPILKVTFYALVFHDIFSLKVFQLKFRTHFSCIARATCPVHLVLLGFNPNHILRKAQIMTLSTCYWFVFPEPKYSAQRRSQTSTIKVLLIGVRKQSCQTVRKGVLFPIKLDTLEVRRP
jgi:hypothetical protein